MASSPSARPPPAADWERWNTHFEKTVSVDLLDTTFRLAQDPASGHLGSTVWDASIVLAGWLEKVRLGGLGLGVGAAMPPRPRAPCHRHSHLPNNSLG